MYDKETIIVYDAKIDRINLSTAEIFACGKPYMCYFNEWDERNYKDTTEIQREVIQSTAFRDPVTGKTIYVGFNKQLQDLMGIQYEAYHNLLHNNESLSYMLAKTQNELSTIENKITLATFWTRLKWLFKGVSW